MAAGSILNNISAIGASRQMGITQAGLEKTIQRLTTGKRINMASDDAAGLAISNRLGADIRISVQARRNAQDGIAYLAVADGALDEVTNLLTRAAELTEQARTGTISASNRQALNLEFQEIARAIYNVSQNAKFNGETVFTDKQIKVAVADYTYQTVTVGTMAAELGTYQKSGTNAKLYDGSSMTMTYNILDVTSAEDAASYLDDALQNISMQRASIGANMQALNTISNTLGIQVENFTAAFSQIRDANIADEVISLTKFQILGQSGTSALSQANQASQMMLGLLR
jgi:flagellin